MMKVILSFVSLIFLQSIIVAQKDSSDCRTFEVMSEHSISKTVGGPDLFIDSYYYKVKLFSDSTFEYLTYSKTKDGENIDSLVVVGKYVLKGRRIYFIHEQYFKNNTGIKWILKKKHILVKGYGTRRTKLIQRHSGSPAEE